MMFARPASVKVSKVETQKSKGRAPVFKNVTGGKKSKESSKKSKNIKQNSKAKTKTQTRHRTQKTVEDSLVKLANRD